MAYSEFFTSETKTTITISVKDLERIVECLDTLYETGDDCIHPDNGKIVTDAEYDEFKTQLHKLNPGSHVFATVTASKIDSDTGRVVHNPPMTSIAKANGTQAEKEDILDKWLDDAGDGGASDFIMTYKHDGVACALYYEDGELVAAGLRPRDGVNGEDITQNARFVSNVPLKLKDKVTCSVRGEIECLNSVFASINGTVSTEGRRFANPRNYTAGSIRQFKDPEKTRARQLTFTAYSVESLDDPLYKTEIEREKWAKKQGFSFVDCRKFSVANLANMEEDSEELDFEVDGIVISVNNLEEQEQLGRHGNHATGNPRGKIAWKFKDELAVVVVKNIRWQVGRTGKHTPVLEFNGVQLEGTTVTQCTGHNVGIIRHHDIKPGTQIEIKKSGKIIPKFERVIKPSHKNVKFAPPQFCQSCGSELEETGGEGVEQLMCPNGECPAQNIGKLVHYLTTIGVKGIAESMVRKLTGNGLVKDIADFYNLDLQKLLSIDITPRMAMLTIARITMITNPEKNKDSQDLWNQILKTKIIEIPIEKFIAALGIPGAGKGSARNLVSHFDDIDSIRSATVEDLVEIEDIGEKIAELLVNFFKENKEIIDRVLENVTLVCPKQGIFSGKQIVFTGTFGDGGRSHWEQVAADEGAKVGSSVSKKTDFLVVGDDPGGTKTNKAATLGTSIINLDKLKAMM
jgi:DNA ligase (NAD+)|tara:strand:+ start:5505 stop:7562 length:2058 start_codon:yes stop_codon:yes gene_type:complete